MKKAIIALALVLLFLTGCNVEESVPEEYTKTTGEVTGKQTESSRFGTNYYVQVSYKVNSKKYSIDRAYVGNDKTLFDEYKLKDKVTIYFNENGIGSIVK